MGRRGSADLADGGGPGAHVADDVEDAAALVELLGEASRAAARLEVLAPASEEDGGEDAQVGLHALELLLEVQHDLRRAAWVQFWGFRSDMLTGSSDLRKEGR